MPTIKTTGWAIATQPEGRQLNVPTYKLSMSVLVKKFALKGEGHSMVYPKDRLAADTWATWLAACRRYALYDPEHRYWVWSNLVLDRYTTLVDASRSLTVDDRKKVREARKLAEEKFLAELAELTKSENVPENLWPDYQYPPFLPPRDPAPTALQRIIVSRYWREGYCMVGASVGTGKTRMTIDMLNARALAPDKALNDSARIVLVVAPLVLHENWKREFLKWKGAGTTWHCHRFAPTQAFWEAVDKSADDLWESGSLKPGGLVIICTPNALSRKKLMQQFSGNKVSPTAIVVDEVHRFFRNPDNNAFRNLQKLRLTAASFIGLSGTPTSKFQDWWALEELMSNAQPDFHWKGGCFTDYAQLGSPDTMSASGLWERGWDFERAIKAFHADRIRKGKIFLADKSYYMKDALPGLDQEELGEFADLRLSFGELFNDYPDWVNAAAELQEQCNPERLKGGEHVLAQVLLLRMRQLAAMSQDTTGLLDEFVEEFLEPGEPCVFWVDFVNNPAAQLDSVVKQLSPRGSVAYIRGGMEEKARQTMIDGFQARAHRFMVCQIDAAGVGLTLTQASKCLFLSIPLSYLSIAQAIGRLHRLGQTNDVTSYFAMTSPVACFARGIYDRRQELNEVIPQKISGMFSPQLVSKLRAEAVQ